MARRWVSLAILSLALVPLIAPPAVGQTGPPEPSFRYTPERPFASEAIQFEDTSDAKGTRIADWRWDFGDGTTSAFQHPTHTYDRPGAFPVTLTITDEFGVAHTTSQTVDVAKAPSFSVHFPSWLYWLMPALSSTVLLALGLIVLTRGQPTIYNRVFFLLCLASSIKGYTEGPLLYMRETGANAGAVGGFLVLVNLFVAFFYAPIFLWFVLVFPRPIRPWLKNGVRGAWFLLLAIPFFVMVTVPSLQSSFSAIFNVYVSLLTLGALGLLVYHAWETDSDEERHRLRLLSATFFIIVFETILIAILDVAATRAELLGHVTTAQTYTELGNVAGTILAPILEIVGLFLVMYGILRYQLLGVESVVKRVTRGAMFGVMMFVTFVTVGNTAEYFIEGRLPGNVPGGFLIAGFVAALAMVPIQKGAERLANRWFPEAGSNAPDYLAQRRMEIYEAQLRYALLDGQLKDKELQMLTALSQSIGIQQTELESVAKKFPGLDLGRLLVPLRAV
jgi:PKD repeat protein